MLNIRYEALSLGFALVVSWLIITQYFMKPWSYEVPMAFYFAYHFIHVYHIKERVAKFVGIKLR